MNFLLKYAISHSCLLWHELNRNSFCIICTVYTNRFVKENSKVFQDEIDDEYRAKTTSSIYNQFVLLSYILAFFFINLVHLSQVILLHPVLYMFQFHSNTHLTITCIGSNRVVFSIPES